MGQYGRKLTALSSRAVQYRERVRGLGCIVCRAVYGIATAAQIHHVREGQGLGQKASDWLVIPLCLNHHTGPEGIHQARFYMRFKLDELDLLAMTVEALHQ